MRSNNSSQMEVDGVPTHVFSLEATAENDTLLYIIPGSPGMGHFYIPFASRLFQLGKGAYDVSVVSHAGQTMREETDTI